MLFTLELIIKILYFFAQLPEISRDKPSFSNHMVKFCANIIHLLDDIDQKSKSEDNLCNRPAVLIFLPGIHEIKELHHVLELEKDLRKWNIVILHSLISTEDQEAIFRKPPKDYRRIILSTNIAESSITVPNVKYGMSLSIKNMLY